MAVADLLVADGVGLVPLALAIVLALGALWEPAERTESTETRRHDATGHL